MIKICSPIYAVFCLLCCWFGYFKCKEILFTLKILTFEFLKTCWKSVFVRREMPRVRTLDQIPQLNDFERGRILKTARRIGRSVETILRCCQAWTPEGREHRARGTGRHRMTTRESRSIRVFTFLCHVQVDQNSLASDAVD
jgi:hypothetical protein